MDIMFVLVFIFFCVFSFNEETDEATVLLNVEIVDGLMLDSELWSTLGVTESPKNLFLDFSFFAIPVVKREKALPLVFWVGLLSLSSSVSRSCSISTLCERWRSTAIDSTPDSSPLLLGTLIGILCLFRIGDVGADCDVNGDTSKSCSVFEGVVSLMWTCEHGSGYTTS